MTDALPAGTTVPIAVYEVVVNENIRHRNANLLRAVMVGVEPDEWITEAINAEDFDRIPWLVAEGLAAEIAALREALPLIESLRVSHLWCEDCWYSCPKAPDGCCNGDVGDDCRCGADDTNARIDAFLTAISRYVSVPGTGPR